MLGPFDVGLKPVQGVDEIACKTDSRSRPATEFGEALEGEALAVTCTRSSSAYPSIEYQYAFLRDSGFYLLLHERTKGESTTARYTEVKYRRH
jgi:hypothetical protein